MLGDDQGRRAGARSTSRPSCARQLTLLDTPGLVGLALAGIDMAAWDALAQARGVPLVTLLGGAPRPIPAYNSTGLWIQPVETLADEAEALLAEGFTAVKLRRRAGRLRRRTSPPCAR